MLLILPSLFNNLDILICEPKEFSGESKESKSESRSEFDKVP